MLREDWTLQGPIVAILRHGFAVVALFIVVSLAFKWRRPGHSGMAYRGKPVELSPGAPPEDRWRGIRWNLAATVVFLSLTAWAWAGLSSSYRPKNQLEFANPELERRLEEVDRQAVRVPPAERRVEGWDEQRARYQHEIKRREREFEANTRTE